MYLSNRCPGLDEAHQLWQVAPKDSLAILATSFERMFAAATGRSLKTSFSALTAQNARDQARVIISTVNRYRSLAKKAPTENIFTSRVLVMVGLTHLPESDTVARLVLESGVERVIGLAHPKSTTRTLFTQAETEMMSKMRGALAQLHRYQM